MMENNFKKFIETKKISLATYSLLIIFVFSNIMAMNSYRWGSVKYLSSVNSWAMFFVHPILVFILFSVLTLFVLIIARFLKGTSNYIETFIVFIFSFIPKGIAEFFYLVVDKRYFVTISLVSFIFTFSCLLIGIKQINDFSLTKATVVSLALAALLFIVTSILF